MRRIASAAVAVTTAALAALAAPAAQAHHSPAMYDREHVVTVDGVVTRVDWANPHVYVFLEQTSEAGETTEWEVEVFPPSMLIRQGWTRDTLQAGDAIIVTANPARNVEHKSLFPVAIESDGELLFGLQESFANFSSASSPETPATSLEGTWETLAAFDLVSAFFLDPASLGPTEAGLDAVESFDETTMHPGLDCSPFTAPLVMYAPDVKRVATGDDEVRIRAYDGAERVIHLDVDTHEGATPSPQGHSIGRWEGETLVIDTARFAPHRSGNGLGLPSGAQKRLVERLTLSEDGARLAYSFELSDPEYLAAPLTGEAEWAYRPDLAFEPPDCTLDNARRFTGD